MAFKPALHHRQRHIDRVTGRHFEEVAAADASAAATILAAAVLSYEPAPSGSQAAFYGGTDG